MTTNDDNDNALDRNIQCDRKIASLQIKNQSKILIQFVCTEYRNIT